VATDRQIDELVYDLYGLTEKEIKVVSPECVEGGILRTSPKQNSAKLGE
jgi:hypothetical protein